MRKLQELKQVKKLVKSILEVDKQARNDDQYLYLQVLKHFEVVLEIPVLNARLEDFLTNPLYIDFPCFETVRRSRQKIQEQNLHLASDKRIAELRVIAEQDYLEFAREV
jgi:hypothetical protein